MRVRIGQLGVDALTFARALDAVESLIGRGGAIFTPNVDHVVLAEEDPEFRAAYSAADLCLADGMPLLWASRLLGRPLPEKISGSDFVVPLMERAARRGWRVYLLGGAPGSARKAASLFAEMGVDVVGIDDSVLTDPRPIVERIRAASPDLLLVAYGAPKQELFIHRSRLEGVVSMGVGGTLDFVAGAIKRAPPWMSRNGLEWLYRLAREPRRLWRRYLVRDPKFALIVWRQLTGRRAALLPPPAPGSG